MSKSGVVRLFSKIFGKAGERFMASQLYPIDVIIYKEGGEKVQDWAEFYYPEDNKHGARKIWLYRANKQINLPDHSAVLNIKGKKNQLVQLYSPKKDSYYVCKPKIGEERLFLDIINENEREGYVQMVKKEMLLTEKLDGWKEFLTKHGPLLATGVYIFMIVIANVIWWQQVGTHLANSSIKVEHVCKIPKDVVEPPV